MNNKETASRDSALVTDQPEWHPYRVWQNQIRSQQSNRVVERNNSDSDNIDNTGTWKATTHNA